MTSAKARPIPAMPVGNFGSPFICMDPQLEEMEDIIN